MMVSIKGIGCWLYMGVVVVLVVVVMVVYVDMLILNVLYDVMCELYKDINVSFVVVYKQKIGEMVMIKQLYGVLSVQVLLVLQGLQVDVVMMNQLNDIDLFVECGQLLLKDWCVCFLDNSLLYLMMMVFFVCKGNLKVIKDWSDFVKLGVQVIIVNLKMLGNGCYVYFVVWGFQKQKGVIDQQVFDFEKVIFCNVLVFDLGGCGVMMMFMQCGIGDVFVMFENEVVLMDMGVLGV